MRKFKRFLILVSCLLFGGGGLTMVSAQNDYNPENPSEPGAIDYCRVTVSTNYPEGANVSGGGRYIANGNSVYISTNARNDENYTYNFQYWTLNGKRTSYSQYFYFTPTKGRFEFVAHYEKIDTPFEPDNPAEPSTSSIKRKYYLYLTSNIEGACSFNMASGNKVEEQSVRYIEAYVNDGYKFEGWRVNNTIISTSRWFSFTMPSTHTTLEAVFTEFPFDPESPSDPSSQGGNVDNTTRKLVNLAIGTGEDIVDKTRIVINETMTLGYDAGTDATKFISNNADYQIYSLDADNVKYSINERPKGDGIIPLGIVIKKAGSVAISATRLDCTAYLVDKTTDISYDLSTKAYVFNGEVGTFEDRFYVKVGSLVDVSLVKADDKTREYGEENPQLTYTVEGASLNGEPVLSTTADKLSPVGTYPIVVSRGTIQGDLGATNGTLTITKASLTISGGTYTIKQGEELPEFKALYEGWKNNETEAVLTTEPTLTTTATSKSKPGEYDITVNGAEAQNYKINYVKGKLTITRGFYNLIYKVGDEVYKTYDVEYGTTIIPETEPTKEGYTFSGWSTIPKTMPAKEVTVTGTFSINKYKLTYKVDGEIHKTFDIEFGTAITPEAEPAKEGYSFSGWSTIPETMPAHDVTVTGSFSKGQYKLIYVADEQTYKTINYDYGDAITPEPAPQKDGYSFSGWSEIPATMPAKDVTVTGSFTINKYSLTYTVDGETYKTYEVEYGADITAEEALTKEGYTFSGWSEIPATMPAKDVTVTGSFTINKYTLTYKVDGETYKTYEVEYGADITAEEAPTKEGYTFSGWSEIPVTMPNKDVTITGTFIINTPEITAGDANGDGTVNVFDVTAMVNYILGSPNDGFVFAAADVNGDGIVNVFDVTKVVNIILGVDDAGAKIRKAEGQSGTDRLYIEDFEIEPGEEREVTILLDNPDAEYRDLQFDLYLPEGITVVQDEDEEFLVDTGSRCTKKHTIGFSYTDGHYVCMLYSTAKNPLSGNSGDILTITLKADGNVAPGAKTGSFRNVSLSKTDATGPTYDKFSFDIKVKGEVDVIEDVDADSVPSIKKIFRNGEIIIIRDGKEYDTNGKPAQ